MRRLSDIREQVSTWRGVEARVGELIELLDLAEAESDAERRAVCR